MFDKREREGGREGGERTNVSSDEVKHELLSSWMAHEPSVDLVDLVLVYEKEGTLDDLREGEKGKEREKGQAGDQTKSGSSEAKGEKLLGEHGESCFESRELQKLPI